MMLLWLLVGLGGVWGCGRTPSDAAVTADTCSAMADIVFLIDDSGSFSDAEYAKYYFDYCYGSRATGYGCPQQISFLKSLAAELTIGPNDVRVAGVKFSSVAQLVFPFQDTASGLQSSIDAQTKNGGSTHIVEQSVPSRNNALPVAPAIAATQAASIKVAVVAGKDESLLDVAALQTADLYVQGNGEYESLGNTMGSICFHLVWERVGLKSADYDGLLTQLESITASLCAAVQAA